MLRVGKVLPSDRVGVDVERLIPSSELYLSLCMSLLFFLYQLIERTHVSSLTSYSTRYGDLSRGDPMYRSKSANKLHFVA
jgi:hypothetical protein